MKNYLYAALVAGSFTALSPAIAQAGGHPHCCGPNGAGGLAVVTIETVVSHRPAPGNESGVILVPGAKIEVGHCDQFGWCHIKYPLVNAFVPADCLEPANGRKHYGPKRRHHGYYGNGHNGYKDKAYNGNGYNGNGYNGNGYKSNGYDY